MENNVILTDIDGTVVNVYDEWYGRYNRDWLDNLTMDRVTEWAVHKFVKPACGLRIYEYLSDPDLYDDAKLIDGASDGIKKLRGMGFRVVFLSSGIHPGKAKLLRKHGLLGDDDRDIIIAHDKSLVMGKYLVDDAPHNIDAFTVGTGILFGDYAHNRDSKHDLRANTWEDVVDTVSLFSRMGVYGR